MPTHPLVMALFLHPSAAAAAARALREGGVPREQVSIVARTHDEEGVLAEATGASPGSELEDSRTASRLGELGAHLLAAIALVMPGIGPIVADGPLAAVLGEAAGHLAGGLSRALQAAGMSEHEANVWQSRVEAGDILVVAHVDSTMVPAAHRVFERCGAERIAEGTWSS